MSAAPGTNYWTCRKTSSRALLLNVRNRQGGAAAMTGHTVDHAGVVGGGRLRVKWGCQALLVASICQCEAEHPLFYCLTRP